MSDAQDLFSALVSQLQDQKAVEDNARKRRIELEETVALHVPGPEKGSKTATLPDGRKVTVERGFNYKADIQALENIFAACPEKSCPVKVKTTRELDEKGYEWYRANQADDFKLISQFVVVTPKKTSVVIKEAK
jgi:hypothetical protein